MISINQYNHKKKNEKIQIWFIYALARFFLLDLVDFLQFGCMASLPQTPKTFHSYNSENMHSSRLWGLKEKRLRRKKCYPSKWMCIFITNRGKWFLEIFKLLWSILCPPAINVHFVLSLLTCWYVIFFSAAMYFSF